MFQIIPILFLFYTIPQTWTQQQCFFQEKTFSGSPSGYKIFYCDTKHERCCGDVCCPIRNPSEITLQEWKSGKFQPFTWFLVVLILIGNAYIIIRYAIKKCYRKTSSTSTSVSISRSNTQPQEVSLMLSFNQHREGLERFHFDNVGSAHLAVPMTPLTPVTPPPAYVTLTPPPTYNVAIHFPPVYTGKKIDIEEEMPIEIKS